MRFRRPGFDYRRPVTSTDPPPPPPSTVPRMSPTLHSYFPPAPSQPSRRVSIVDLTQDPDPPEIQRRTPRQPRFGRNIMSDVVDLEAETAAPTPAPNPIPPSSSSPEVQFLGAAVRHRPQHPPPLPTPASARHAHGPFGVMASFREGNLGFENLLRQFTSGSLQPYLEGGRPDLLHQEIDARTRRHLARALPPLHPLWVQTGNPPGIDLTVDLDEDGPVRLNYTIYWSHAPSRRVYKDAGGNSQCHLSELRA
jgi:hypothetical protein